MKGLYKKKGSDWWYFQPPTGPDGKRPKARALRVRDEVDAIIEANKILYGEMTVQAETKGTISDVLPSYLLAKSDDKASTKRQREIILNLVKDQMGNPRVMDISKEMIDAWRGSLARGDDASGKRSLSTTTVTTYFVVLRAFLNWCVSEKLIRKNPASGMGKQALVRKTRRQEFLTIEQRERLLARPGSDEVMLVLYFGFFAGLRIGEMMVMTPSWFFIADDWSYGSITVQPTEITYEDGTKGQWMPKSARGTRTIPLHPRLLEFLRSYGLRSPFILAPDKPVFSAESKQTLRFSPRKALGNHAKSCGIAKIGFHMLRHSFGTHLAMGGASMAEIAGLLGNLPSVTEASYAGYSRGIRKSLPGL